MKTLVRVSIIVILLGCFKTALAADQEVNVFIWANWVSPRVVEAFEKETGIKVNLTTYDSNETLYAKFKAAKNPGYDVIAPSSYYVQRFAQAGMLEKISHKQLKSFANLDKHFLNKAYDPGNIYSVPFAWGVTGIFVNNKAYPAGSIKGWQDLWDAKFRDQLLLLDDSRDVIPMALLIMGYSVNDTNPEHLRAAYLKLQPLMKNVKLFNVDAITSILIDQDASVGMAWNGDVYRAHRENKELEFVYPKEGFVIWLDCLAIAKDAPHVDNARRFIDFLLRPDIASSITVDYGFATANSLGQKQLPEEIRKDPMINPPLEVLERGEIQKDVGDQALAIYEKYWQQLKMEA